MPLITAAQLARVASKAVPHVVNAIVDHADDVLPRYGIVTPLRVQHFLAQCLEETGGFRTLEENLSYSAAGLRKTWPTRFRTDAAAQAYAHRPQAIANLVYGGRLGNRPDTDDGWQGRGLGLLQNTGRAGRERLAKILHASPDQVTAMLVDDGWLLECAAADFVALGCLPHADRDDIEGVTRCVNGGLINLANRKAALVLCRKVWTPSAVIAPTLATRSLDPVTLKPVPKNPAMPASTAPQNAAIAALERIASDPHTYEMIGKGVDAIEKGVATLPNSGPLSGYKTYIVAALGVVGTAAVVIPAMMSAGGLTPAGYLAGIVALVTSGGFASMRAALQANHRANTDDLLNAAQSIIMQLAPAGAVAVTAPVEAAADALGAVESGVVSLIPR